MTTVLESVGNRKEILLLGDLNGRIGNRVNDPVVGQFGEITVNNSGERIIETCQQYGLKIANGWFEHKNIHRYTWTQSTRQLQSIIDYIIIRQKTRFKVMDVRVKRGFECGSDHHLVTAKIYFPYNQSINKISDTQTVTHKNIRVKYNLDGLQEDSTKFLYQLRLAAKLAKLQEGSAENMYNDVKRSIHEAATEALGEAETNNKNDRRERPWWNEELRRLVDEKKQHIKNGYLQNLGKIGNDIKIKENW